MRILLCLLPLAVIAAAPASDHNPVKIVISDRTCPAAAFTPAADKAPLRTHPLNDEPGARQEIAVLRTGLDGCPKPIVVRENVGGKSPPDAQTSSTSRP